MTNQKRRLTKRTQHGHAKFHNREKKFHPKAVRSPAEHDAGTDKDEDWVVANIDGKVVSWINNYFGPTTAATSPPVMTPVAKPRKTITKTIVKVKTESSCPKETPEYGAAAIGSTISSTTTRPTVAAPTKVPTSASDGDYAYTREGYYNAQNQTLDGLTFIGNYGGQKSGVWDSVYGNSLSYLDSSGVGGAESAEILADTTIPSNTEFAIFTDKECTEATCGYFRDGTVAYQGFDGADKIFLFEFSMPFDGAFGFNANMPAIWMLNANIPRTLQYGKADCSCWTTGCGEFDIAETLHSGSLLMKSTVHTNTPGGDSNYIARPTESTMKLAVIFSSANTEATIQVLPDNVNFDTGLTNEQIAGWTMSVPPNMMSLFEIVA